MDLAGLLDRHTRVAADLFVIGEPLYVFQSRFSTSRRQRKMTHSVAGRQLSTTSMLLPVNPGVIAIEDDDILATRALQTTWKPDFFDRLVTDVAHDKEHLVALVSPSSKNIYCPYDGGMDVFAFSTAPSRLKEKFSDWLSARPDGL